MLFISKIPAFAGMTKRFSVENYLEQLYNSICCDYHYRACPAKLLIVKLRMLNRRRRKINSPAGNADAAQMMNLALFIMLLAFFIVLNAISSFEEVKTQPIVKNLQETFSTDVRFEEESPSIVEDPVESIHDGDTIERIESLFQAQISGFKATKSEARGMMFIDVPLSDFSTAVMAIEQEDLSVRRIAPSQADGAFFLPTLISILKSDEQGRTYRMDMIYYLEGNPAALQNENPQAVNAVVRRAGQLTRKLEEAGLSQRLMSFSLQKGDPDTITLVFAPHTPFDPTYGQEEEGEAQ